MIDLKNKVIFVHIPKTGGTSIEHYFMKLRGLSGLEGAAVGIGINDKRSALERQNGHNTFEMYRDLYFGGEIPQEYRLFTVVRDPFTRFVSELSSRRLPPPNRFPLSFYLSERVLMGLAARPLPILKDLNSHLRTQSSYLAGDGRGRVTILRFENLNDEFGELMRSYGLPSSELPMKNRSSIRRLRNAERVREFVSEFYQHDYRSFGY